LKSDDSISRREFHDRHESGIEGTLVCTCTREPFLFVIDDLARRPGPSSYEVKMHSAGVVTEEHEEHADEYL